MNLYYSNTYSDEDGKAEEIKSAMIYADKEALLKICDFFEKIKRQLNNDKKIHMHLCDHYEGWTKGKDFDLEVNFTETDE